jgi:hypothetical protein
VTDRLANMTPPTRPFLFPHMGIGGPGFPGWGHTEERAVSIQGLHPPHRDRMRRNRGVAGLDTTGESWVDMNSVGASGAMGSMGRGGRGRNLNGRRTGGWQARNPLY